MPAATAHAQEINLERLSDGGAPEREGHRMPTPDQAIRLLRSGLELSKWNCENLILVAIVCQPIVGKA